MIIKFIINYFDNARNKAIQIGTHIFLLGIVGKALCFVMFIWSQLHKTKSTYFYLTVKVRI